MHFYLDKKDLINNQIRCLWTNNTPISEEEKENWRKYWNKRLGRKDVELVEYEADNLPSRLGYDLEENRVIELPPEPIQIAEEAPVPTIVEKQFGESIRGMKYFYIDKKIAIEEGTASTTFDSKKRLLNYKEYYENEVIEYLGESLPFYVKYLPEFDTIREATGYEAYLSGKKLADNEVVLESKQEIVTIGDGQYVENDEVITVSCPEEYLVRVWNKEARIWEDQTTDLDRVQKEHREYEQLDTPRNFLKMEKAGVLEDYNSFMDSCEEYFLTAETTRGVIPRPSLALKTFFNKLKI